MELALDTSTETASIALASRGLIRAEFTWHAGQNHSVELLPNIEYVLKVARVSIEEIGAVIVARGPGSFNGLRVGLSTAKALCLARNILLVGIGTLEVEAYPHAGRGLPVWAVADAGRGEVASAMFQTRRGRWEQLVAERITTVDELCAGVQRRAVFCGRMNEAIVTRIGQLLGHKGVVIGGAAALRRAGYLAELGWRRLEAGDTDDPASLQPIYLRRPHITEARPLYPRP